jgi:squalene-hopene/tetraprenyl-beta-curcumene cyclase
MSKPASRVNAAIILALTSCAPAVCLGQTTVGSDVSSGWRADAAGRYLDERQSAWFEFDSRGEAATRSTCVSCHSVLPYLLARPALHRICRESAPPEQETKLLAQTRLRVENWSKLDSDAFGLFYDSSDEKKQQSWGTEAVFNAAILAFSDRNQERSSPSETTRQAFTNLWATQAQDGEHQGSWNWLDFKEPPWGCQEARYFGAALAAIAVGTAPGYYTPGRDAETDRGVELQRGYLRDHFAKQNLHDQVWALWAAARLDGVLAKDEQDQVMEQALGKQRDDGGWALPSLGPWIRNDGTPQEADSDGYATGLILHVLQTAGVPTGDSRIAKGLAWLKANQTASGAWHCASVVKRRDPESHVGKFMSDAATAFAVLALGH